LHWSIKGQANLKGLHIGAMIGSYQAIK